MKFLLFYSPVAFLIFLGYLISPPVAAQDCPNNTQGGSAYRIVVGSQSYLPENYYTAYRQIRDVYTFTSDCNNGTVTYSLFNPQYGTRTGSLGCALEADQSCSCSDGQIASTDALGNVTSCSEIADVPDQDECSDSWDIAAGACGDEPANCAASGGSFGFVNGTAVCIPAAASGDGDEPPECDSNSTLTYGASGSEGSFTCVANEVPDEGCPAGTNEINGACVTPDPQTEGCTFEGAADSDCDDIIDRFDPDPRGPEGGSDTGGTRESVDIDTGVTTTVACNPSREADCTPNAGNSGAGQCDPEAIDYFECSRTSLTATPSDGCAVPPTCSGDAIFCAMMFQDFNLSCKTSVVIADSCDAAFSCNADAATCSIARSAYVEKCNSESLFDMADSHSEFADFTLPNTDFIVTDAVDNAFAATSIFGNGSCPADVPFSFSLLGSTSMSYEPVCNACVSLRPAVSALSMLAGLYIIFGFKRKS